jgi:hypothetical protein
MAKTRKNSLKPAGNDPKNGRLDDYCEMISDAHRGEPDAILGELDAMAGIIKTWSGDSAAVEDFQTAGALAILSDLISIVALDITLRARAVSQGTVKNP